MSSFSSKTFALFSVLTILLSANSFSQEEVCEDSYSDQCCNRFWTSAEFIYWNIKNSPKLTPLVVEGPVVADGSPTLLLPDNEVVLGGKHTHNGWRPGGRFGVGCWFDAAGCFGAEANFFFLAGKNSRHSVFSDGSAGAAFLTIPFNNSPLGQESSVTIARQGEFSGLASLKVTNRTWGGEISGLTSYLESPNVNITFLGGFRYWNFDEHFKFDTSSPNVPPRTADTFLTHDSFHAKNNFYAGQLGAKLDYYLCDNFFINLVGKVAIGAMCQDVDIRGNLITDDFTNFTTLVTYPGGYFALPTNLGRHHRTCCAIMPEANINVGYSFMDCVKVQVGYTYIFVSDVVYATKQVNRHLNPTQSAAIEFTDSAVLVGRACPQGKVRSSSFWMHGVNVGLEVDF